MHTPRLDAAIAALSQHSEPVKRLADEQPHVPIAKRDLAAMPVDQIVILSVFEALVSNRSHSVSGDITRADVQWALDTTSQILKAYARDKSSFAKIN